MIQKEKTYDLEERTAVFGENIVKLCKSIPKNAVTLPIIGQIIRSGTSIGANYCEANGASSKRDFRNKIFICKKESKETKYWLRLLTFALEEDGQLKAACQFLEQEVHQLILIFGKIAKNSE